MSVLSLAGLIRTPNTLNRYIYVQNSPLNLVDPAGLFGVGDFLSNAKDLGKSLAKEIGATLLTSAYKGGRFAYQTYNDVGVIVPGAINGIKNNLTGHNLLKGIQSGIADFAVTKILEAIISQGGEVKVSDTPVLSWIPGPIGSFFSAVPSAGETIDDEGNVYDANGNLISSIALKPQLPPLRLPVVSGSLK